MSRLSISSDNVNVKYCPGGQFKEAKIHFFVRLHDHNGELASVSVSLNNIFYFHMLVVTLEKIFNFLMIS